ncbi:MAG: hypothetical protein U5O69_00985 [Candidatus Competibacteraceae bacterium]|nr:hypothetical protein [Candidatus Competibacteraceae bacterium]
MRTAAGRAGGDPSGRRCCRGFSGACAIWTGNPGFETLIDDAVYAGFVLPQLQEERQRADQERQRAEQAERSVEQERARAAF